MPINVLCSSAVTGARTTTLSVLAPTFKVKVQLRLCLNFFSPVYPLTSAEMYADRVRPLDIHFEILQRSFNFFARRVVFNRLAGLVGITKRRPDLAALDLPSHIR